MKLSELILYNFAKIWPLPQSVRAKYKQGGKTIISKDYEFSFALNKQSYFL